MRAARDVLSLRLLMVAALLAVMALLVVLPLIALHVDAQSVPYESDVARAQLEQSIRRLALRTEEGAIDDTVLHHADPQLDQAWFQKNMTSPRVADVESQIVYTFDTDDHVVFARERGIPITGARQQDFARALRPIVASLRRRERGSERARRDPQPGFTPPVIAAAATILVGGRVFDVQALLVSSKSGTVAQRAAHAPVLMLVTDIEQCLLPPLRDHLKLRDVAIVRQRPSPDQGAISLVGIDGTPTAYLVWTPRQPGMELLRRALPPILIVVAMLIAAVVFAYRRGTRNAVALAASEARSYHLAFYDQLTDLANRRSFNERLETLLARSAHDGLLLALLLIDLDRFKFVNDTFGHQSGDELIQEIARRLSASVGSDDLCARLGGDEFVILSADCDPGKAAKLATRVLALLKMPVELSTAIVETTGSIGIAMHMGGHGDAGDLVRKADLALYRVKDNGRDDFCFFEIEMDQMLQDRRALEIDLKEALLADRLGVEYLPQFTGSTMTGVSARVRWDHATRGPVSPAVFVRLAEECGQIDALGFNMIRQVFADSGKWPGLRVAIDISPAQLRLPAFLPKLLAMIEDSGVDPARLDWEISESSFTADDIPTQHALAKLRQLGGRLVLDDLGKGHSSLRLLKRFPIDRIMIDRFFLAGLPDDQVSGAMVRAVLGLGDALGFDVIADGVETEAQRTALATIGCLSIQGGLMGNPETARGIDAMLSNAGPTAGKQIPVSRIHS